MPRPLPKQLAAKGKAKGKKGKEIGAKGKGKHSEAQRQLDAALEFAMFGTGPLRDRLVGNRTIEDMSLVHSWSTMTNHLRSLARDEVQADNIEVLVRSLLLAEEFAQKEDIVMNVEIGIPGFGSITTRNTFAAGYSTPSIAPSEQPTAVGNPSVAGDNHLSLIHI